MHCFAYRKAGEGGLPRAGGGGRKQLHRNMLCTDNISTHQAVIISNNQAIHNCYICSNEIHRLFHASRSTELMCRLITSASAPCCLLVSRLHQHVLPSTLC
jgi:hypothetical protein